MEFNETVVLRIRKEDLMRIASSFEIRGKITKVKQINKGYINLTYEVDTLSEAGHEHKYILQRINTNVFPDVDALMENFELVTEHLKNTFRLPGGEPGKPSTQCLKLTHDNQRYLKDPTGCWRVVKFFDDVYSLDTVDQPETFRYAGEAFGLFVKKMADVDAAQIHEVIPHFHNTFRRYCDLKKSVERDPVDRVKDVQPELDSVESRQMYYGMIPLALENGLIPTRICHNDCNLNNILFDNESHLPVAIIDLDTVMPSSPLYDYGDSMRIGTNHAKDDEKDLSKVYCDLDLYEQYARGYLSACGDMLTREELELLPYASIVIASEDGIRFLMDYIDGDTYYTIEYPQQNLDRSRTQLRLAQDMVEKLPQIKAILSNIYKELGLKANL